MDRIRYTRNHYSFFSVNTPVEGFDTSRDVFLENNQGNAFPDAVREQKWKAPNVIRKTGAHELLKHFSTTQQVEAAFAHLKNTGMTA